MAKPLFASFCAMFAANLPASGQSVRVWITATNGLFDDASKWSGSTVPTDPDAAVFSQPSPAYTVSFPSNFTNAELWMSFGDVTFDLMGNTYTIDGETNLTTGATIGADPGDDVELTVANGVLSVKPYCIIGRAGATGMLNLDTGSELKDMSELVIGQEGTGFLNLSGGAIAETYNAPLGSDPDGVGTMSVADGSYLTVNNQMYVGEYGQGTLVISNGGIVEVNDHTHLGGFGFSSGRVTVTGMFSIWDQAGDLEIGRLSTGTVTVENGGIVNAPITRMGTLPGGHGTLTVTGGDSRWYQSADPLWAGSEDFAQVNILDGAEMQTQNAIFGLELFGDGHLTIETGGKLSSVLSILGNNPGSSGSAMVSGDGSRWDTSAQIQVGRSGYGELTISNQADVTSAKAASGSQSSALIGVLAGGEGHVTVTGDESSWTQDGGLNVGFNSTGTLNIEDSAFVSSLDGFIGRNAGSDGTVTVTGNSGWNMTRKLYIGGNAAASGGTGRLYVNDGASVTATTVGPLQSTLTIWPTGTLALDGGDVSVTPQRLTSSGLISGSGTIHGIVLNPDGEVAPGTSAGLLNIDGSYGQGSDGVLSVEIGGLSAVSQYDRLSISGGGYLRGTLDVSLINAFVPSPGNTFEIIQYGSRAANPFDSSFSYSFQNVVGTIPVMGQKWAVDYQDNRALLKVCNDPDNDGLCSDIDAVPSTPSGIFSDGSGTHGTAGAVSGGSFLMYDAASPSRGVWLKVDTGGVLAPAPHCGFTRGRYRYTRGLYLITCGSVSLEALDGTATAEFDYDGNIYTIDVNAGGAATFVELDNGVEVTVTGEPGTVTLNGSPIDPGETVDTTPPAITAFNGTPLLVAVGSAVDFSAAFEDNAGDTHEATYNFGDGSADEVLNPATSPALASHVYSAAGIYTVTVTITDSCEGCSNSATANLIVVVFDPSAGFTTGGGWFVPDSNSFVNNVGVTDTVSKAKFGFVVKYHQGASTPNGNLEFVYKAGDINLRSTEMDWLVITSNSKVRFKGQARINNLPDLYTFKVTAEDNGEPGTSDIFKIEIWLGPDVDTESGGTPKHNAQGTLGGGNIRIHH